MFGEFNQGFALVVVSLFVDIDIIEVPTAEGFEHALAFRALNKLAHGKSIERCFAILAFADENDLCAVTGHARGERREPAAARGIAGAGFFEFAGNFPGNFGRGGVVSGVGGESAKC